MHFLQSGVQEYGSYSAVHMSYGHILRDNCSKECVGSARYRAIGVMYQLTL